MMTFEKMSNSELLEIIDDESLDWNGSHNGDTTAKYQGRQCFKYAAALILVGRELESGETILTKKQSSGIFFNILRHLLDTSSIDGESGVSRFCPETMLNIWKVKFEGRNLAI